MSKLKPDQFVPRDLFLLPCEAGAGRTGCAKGPDALLRAGLGALLPDARVTNVIPEAACLARSHPNGAIKSLDAVVAWTRAIHDAALNVKDQTCPIFVGGDHAIAGGTIPAMAQRATKAGRPLFVLWLDAHPDCHSLMTTQSGHLHGVPLAYVSGQSGFSEFYPALETAVDPAHIGIFGLRSIDAAEQAFLDQSEIQSVTMDQIRAQGIGSLLDGFLDQVRQANGMLHVSFDVDWLDPLVAPAVGTPVVNGVTMSEASEVMTRLQASGLVSSLDLVEFNPDCDEGERTAEVVITLLAQLLGRCEGLKQAA